MKYKRFFLRGHPKPKGSWTPIKGKKGRIFLIHSSKFTAAWCKSIEKQVPLLWKHKIITGAVKTKFEFLLPKPKTVKRKYPIGKFEGDLDKLVRAIFDAMTGTVYADDSQVVSSSETKRYTDKAPGVWVTVSTDL